MAKVYRWSVEFLDRGVQCVSSLHYQTDVPIAGSEPSASLVLDEIDQHFSSTGTNMSKWRSCANNSAVLVATRVYEEVDPDSGDAPTGAINTYGTAGSGGTVGSDSLPVELCTYISLTTDKLGRSFRGGVHSPPTIWPAVLTAAGTLDHAQDYYTDLTALAVLIIDVIDNVFSSTGDIKPIIYSRTRRRRGLDFTEDLSGYRVNDKTRWLRRRATAP